MSGIIQILELKGDKKVLVPTDGKHENPWIAVEGGGTYKDYEYLIVLNTLGHRCGYVAIPPSHKFDSTPLGSFNFAGREHPKYDYDSLNIECHGGLTFMERKHGLKDLLPIPCNDFWIGFDCGHCYDRADLNALREYFGEEAYLNKKSYEFDDSDATIRDFEYVEENCKSIIDQLIAQAA